MLMTVRSDLWLLGHVLDMLSTLPDGSHHACVTSPPYFGLRDYGTDGQEWPEVTFAPMPGLPPMTIPAMRCPLGNEPDPWAFVGHLVLVFREVRRVLRDDGTLWLNLGDSYAGSWGAQSRPETSDANDIRSTLGGASMLSHRQMAAHPKATGTGSLKHTPGLKNKDLIGIPWRVAFALQADGWFLRMDNVWSKPNPMPESVTDRPTKAHEYVFLLAKSARYFYDAAAVKETAVSDHPSGNGFKRDARLSFRDDAGARGNEAPWTDVGGSRNRRSVWTISPQPFAAAHFATMPPALAEVAVLAGTPADGRVLDPFGGAGTTALVSRRKGRTFTHIELSEAYMKIARDRFEDDAPLFNRMGAA
jgi:DNA modification methylase